MTASRPPGRRAVGQAAEGDFQRLEFVVHGDSQGLKGPRGRVDAVVPGSGNTAPHQFRQIGGRFYRMVLPPLDDRPSNPPAVTLLAVEVNQVGQVFGIQPLQQAPSRLAPQGIEPQIQRAGRGKTESPVEIGQLIARKSEVQQEPIHRLHPKLDKDLGQVAEIGMDGLHGQIGQILAGRFNGRWVAVQGNDRSAGPDSLGERAVCPPPPSVPSTKTPPGWGDSPSNTSASITGT